MSKKDTAVQIFSFLGVLFTLASLFVSVSALVKDTWITGGYQVQISYYQWKTCAVKLGFFSSCNSCRDCGGTFSWIPGAIDSELYTQWTTLQAFFMMHLFFAGLSFAFMQSTAVKPCLVTVLKFAAPSAYVANFVTGMIAVTLSTTQIPRLGNYGSWNRDISINLQIASFSIATAGLIFHAIGRCIRARKNKTEDSSIDTPLLDGPAYQSIQEQPQPQQIAVVVNGQTVMATVNPTQPGTPVQVVPSGDAYNPAFGHPQQLMASWGQHSPAVFYQVQQPQL